MSWTMTAVDFRGGVVGELDIRVTTGETASTITLFQFPAGWRVPPHLDLPPSMRRAALHLAHEAVGK